MARAQPIGLAAVNLSNMYVDVISASLPTGRQNAVQAVVKNLRRSEGHVSAVTRQDSNIFIGS